MKNWLWFCSILLVSPAFADDAVVSVDAGTSGLGLHIGYLLQNNLQARVGINYADVNTSRDVNNLSYDLKLKLHTFDMLLDWYPLEDGIHLTGGLIINGNKFSGNAVADANQNYVIQGDTYNATQAGVISSYVDYRSVAPYLGVGWESARQKQKGWGFSGDLGLLYQGNSTVTMTNSGCTLGTVGGINLCQNLENDLASERNATEDKANKFKYLPLLRAGVSYRF